MSVNINDDPNENQVNYENYVNNEKPFFDEYIEYAKCYQDIGISFEKYDYYDYVHELYNPDDKTNGNDENNVNDDGDGDKNHMMIKMLPVKIGLIMLVVIIM